MMEATTIQTLQDEQAASIRLKTLTKGQLDLVYAKNWFNIWVPGVYGGKELSLPEGSQLLEELAYWDGSFAWTVTLCAGANMFAGFLDPEVAKVIFSDPEVCWGGSGQVGGNARLKDGKYIISGFWKYATGAPHLTHFTLNCFVYDNGVQVLNTDNSPVVRSFFVPRDQVLNHYDWDTFGLESTASHSFSLENIEVSTAHSFLIAPEEAKVDHLLYKIPFMPFAEITLCANYLGMYRRFLTLGEKYFFEQSKNEIWATKYSKARFRLMDELTISVDKERHRFYSCVDAIWRNISQGQVADNEPLYDEIAELTRAMVSTIKNNISQLFPLLGIQAAQRNSEINIVFRNIFTATQHSLLNIR